jgi:hypothetical protein
MRYKVQIRQNLEAIEIRTNYLKQATEGSKPITPKDAIKMIDEILFALGKVNDLIDLEREGN